MVTNSLIDRLIELIDPDTTHVGIGTGTAPINTDTTLDAESERKTAVNTIDGFTLLIEGFWDTDEANSTNYLNAGCFGNGATGTIGTGELFVGGEIDVTKNTSQTLTLSIELTLEAI